MLNTYVYETNAPVIKLVQVTDSHLFKQRSGELLGINTLESFNQVLKEIRQSDFAYDLALATGDLVQDDSIEGYQYFCESAQQLQKMLFWIPGNHDFQPKMFDILSQEQNNISPKKHLLLGDHWQVLLLDSQVYGVSYGQLGQYQLDWLQSKLKEYPERYALVVLHHHILSTGSAWLDQHNLRNSYDLALVLSAFPKVRGILYGHIHQQVDKEWQGYKLMATPSTCIQFKADSHHFSLDKQQPGWREIELWQDGSIQSRVKRIKQALFLPNMLSEGY